MKFTPAIRSGLLVAGLALLAPAAFAQTPDTVDPVTTVATDTNDDDGFDWGLLGLLGLLGLIPKKQHREVTHTHVPPRTGCASVAAAGGASRGRRGWIGYGDQDPHLRLPDQHRRVRGADHRDQSDAAQLQLRLAC